MVKNRQKVNSQAALGDRHSPDAGWSSHGEKEKSSKTTEAPSPRRDANWVEKQQYQERSHNTRAPPGSLARGCTTLLFHLDLGNSNGLSQVLSQQDTSGCNRPPAFVSGASAPSSASAAPPQFWCAFFASPLTGPRVARVRAIPEFQRAFPLRSESAALSHVSKSCASSPSRTRPGAGADRPTTSALDYEAPNG